MMLAGFDDPVLDSQCTFRAVLTAMAQPGRIVRVDVPVVPPAPLHAASAALALTLVDFEAPVWVDAAIGEAACEWLRFHTGAPIAADPAQARFAIVGDPAHPPELMSFDCGTDERPERSVTLVLQVAAIVQGRGLRLSGPGIPGDARLDVPELPGAFWTALQANHRLFPRGVDVIFAAQTSLVALPRTTRIAYVA